MKNLKFIVFQQRLLTLILLIATLTCCGIGFGQIVISGASPYNYSQDFNTFLGTSATAGMPTGWVQSGSGTYNGQGNGSSATGGVWAYGTGTDRSLGGLNSNSAGLATYTVTFQNTTGSTITGLTVSYNYEGWRNGGGNTGALTVSSSLGTTVATPLTVTTYAAGTVAKTTGALTVSIANNATFTIAFVNTNLTGSDNGVSLDDFTLTATYLSNTITTGAVTGAPFLVPGCSNTGTVAFTSTGTFTAGNVYTAQLSDASGAFGSPTSIGTLTSTANSGTINVTLPAGAATGTGYKIRVISSTPSVTGSLSTAFTINNGSSGTAGLWTGTQSTDWFDCRNWSNYAIPTSTTDVAINQTATNDCVINANGAVCKTLTISSNNNVNHSLTINATRTLTVSGAVALNKTAGTGDLELNNDGTVAINTAGNFSVTKSGATTGTITITNSSTGTLAVGAGSLTMIQSSASGTGDNILFTNAGAVTTSGTGNTITLSKSGGSGNVVFDNVGGTVSCSAILIDGSTAGTGEVKLRHELSTGLITVNGSLTMQPGGQLDLNGASTGGTIKLRGNYINNATEADFIEDLSTVIFDGTPAQDISIAGTNTEIFYNVTVIKGLAPLTLSNDVQVRNELTMTSGNIDTDPAAVVNTLELGESIASKGTLTYTAGYVLGRMRRWFDGTNAGNASSLFPMGYNDSGIKNRNVSVEYAAAATDGGHLTVEFILIDMGMAGIPIPAPNSGGAGFDVTSTEDLGYWKIDNQPGTLLDGLYQITCTGEGFGTINDISMLTLLKRVVAVGPDWFCPGVHIPATGTPAVPVLARSGVSGWSNFGFGGADANPLPVGLASFSANCADGEVTAAWTTLSEQNSDYFLLEKTTDGSDWNPAGTTDAAGNSFQSVSYSLQDPLFSHGVSYYRLVQFDLDGKNKTYGPVSVNCASSEETGMSVYPNPSHGTFTVAMHNPYAQSELHLVLTSSDGKTVFFRTLALEPGENMLPIENTSFLPGIYFLTADSAVTGRQTLRMIIE